MANFLHFLRASSNRLFRGKSDNHRSAPDSHERHSTKLDVHSSTELSVDTVPRCIHLDKQILETLWEKSFESHWSSLLGIVAINPNFARSRYVPRVAFRIDFEHNEFNTPTVEQMGQLKSDYTRCMETLLGPDSALISHHLCYPSEMLRTFAVRCPKLCRLSAHYYYLDPHFIDFIVHHLPNLEGINLENSIGISSTDCMNLGLLRNLTYLNLSGCDIYEQMLAKLLDSCQSLESLDISNNSAITGHCLTNPSIRRLRRLNLQDCWRIEAEQLCAMAQRGLPIMIELLVNSGLTDNSLEALVNACPKLAHLDISFEEFTYFDCSGSDVLSPRGFTAIAQLSHLRVLRLRHVGRLTDHALGQITSSCSELVHLVLNLRHRHKLTGMALESLGNHCPNLVHFEAVHSHFIGGTALQQLSTLRHSLQVLVLRGNELLGDEDASGLVNQCNLLRQVNLDGCREVSDCTLAACLSHARRLLSSVPEPSSPPLFQVSLVLTGIERTLINSLYNELPDNLRIRACDYRKNKEHFNEFDGHEVREHKLRDRFYPFYWEDYN